MLPRMSCQAGARRIKPGQEDTAPGLHTILPPFRDRAVRISFYAHGSPLRSACNGAGRATVTGAARTTGATSVPGDG